tara:strand:+ start:19 stop:345 length:327 start_codon:yes stop_codon:yes gene_type:complete
MQNEIFILFGALGVLGSAVYGSIQVIKAATSSAWRKSSRGGRVAMKAAPLLLGAGLCAIPGLLSGLGSLFGSMPELTLSARVVVGIAAGAFATTYHSMMRRRINAVSP